MKKYDKQAQQEWLNNFSKWEDSKAIGKAEMFVAFVSVCAFGYLVGYWL